MVVEQCQPVHAKALQGITGSSCNLAARMKHQTIQLLLSLSLFNWSLSLIMFQASQNILDSCS